MKSLFHIDLYIVVCAGIEVAKLQCFLRDELPKQLFCDFLVGGERAVRLKAERVRCKNCQFEDLKAS
jgi:hypothetical protein